MRRSFLLRSVAAAPVAIASALACSARAGAQAPLPIVRVGAAPYDTFAEAYYAQDLGAFKRAGLDVQIEKFTSGEKISVAVTGGAIDIGLDNPIHLALSMAHGAPFVIVGGGSLYSSKVPTTALYVARASKIAGAKDLEGTVVAISGLKNIQELGMKAWFAQNGADVSKVKFIELPTAEMAPAIDRGTVAAALLAEPFLSAALHANTVRLLANAFDSVGPQFYINTWFATPQYAQKNADVVKRFMGAVYEAAKWANTHSAETAQILAREAKLDPESLKSLRRAVFAESLDTNALMPQLDIGVKYGVLERAMTMNELLGR